MNVKEKIIQNVTSIEDPELLDEILDLISIEADTDEVYQFNPAERKNILEGISDAKRGRTYSQQEAENLISKWLNLSGLSQAN